MAAAKQKLCIGVVLNLGSSSLSQMVGGVMDYIRQKNKSWRIEVANVDRLVDPSAPLPPFDGAVITPPPNVAMNQTRFPFVLIRGDTSLLRLDAPTVEISHATITEMAVKHLRSKGVKCIGLASYPHFPDAGWIVRREEVFLEQCRLRNAKASVFTPDSATEVDTTRLNRALKKWLGSLPRPAAVLAINDFRAMDVQSCCWQSGLRIPEDIALMGIDNNPAICPFMNPPLTSVEPNYRRIGYHAAAMLDSILIGKTKEVSTLTFRDFVLMERASTDILVPQHGLVEMALQYIRNHCSEPIRAADIHAALRVSHTALARHFKNEMDSTVHDNILRIRLHRARELLADITMPLKEVAVSCGFQSSQYFSTVFKKYSGTTPAEYRARLSADFEFFPEPGP